MTGLAIKSVSCLIPGFGDEGAKFGELVPTAELLENITNINGRPGKIGSDFVAQRLGIESVAFTWTTSKICRQFWRQRDGAQAALPYTAYPNACLYQMLARAVGRAIAEGGPPFSVCAHLHIVTYPQPTLEYELVEVRQRAGIDHGDLHTLVIQQGCAGLFSALKTAQALLASRQYAPDDTVLITAENNMLPFVQQRSHAYADIAQIDSWVFPAIFGEGVGAMVVGRAGEETSPGVWKIDTLTDEIVETEWRVAPCWNDVRGCSEIVVRSKEVKQTYLTHVTGHAQRAIEACGGPDRVHRLCLHESNPLLVKQVARRLNQGCRILTSFSEQL